MFPVSRVKYFRHTEDFLNLRDQNFKNVRSVLKTSRLSRSVSSHFSAIHS